MKNQNKIELGIYSNGVCVVCGFLFKGKIYGLIIKTFIPNLYKQFSFGTYNQYINNYKLPFFRKKLSLYKRLFFFTKYSNKLICKFLEEIADLPTCCWSYQDIFDTSKRTVIVEKYNSTSKLKYYKQLNSFDEFFMVKIIGNKYGKSIIKNVYYNTAKPTVKDPLSSICYINVNCFHSTDVEKILVEFKSYEIMSRLYETILRLFQQENENKF